MTDDGNSGDGDKEGGGGGGKQEGGENKEKEDANNRRNRSSTGRRPYAKTLGLYLPKKAGAYVIISIFGHHSNPGRCLATAEELARSNEELDEVSNVLGCRLCLQSEPLLAFFGWRIVPISSMRTGGSLHRQLTLPGGCRGR